jgi:dihydroorotate dehydrogenase electron transfer subunit
LKQISCRVSDNRILWGDVQLLTCAAPELARALRPGQFALARDATTFDPYLRRTLWLYHIEGNQVAFTLAANDPLARRARAGDELDLLAPLGHAIEFASSARHILLIGEDTRIAQLIASAHAAVAQGREVVLVSSSTLNNFPVHLLSPEIEYRSEEGLNSEVIAWADSIIASGSAEFYRALAGAIRATRYRLEPGFARVLVDLPMPCGTGACCACAVDTARGIRLACVDGPAFDLAEFENRRAR